MTVAEMARRLRRAGRSSGTRTRPLAIAAAMAGAALSVSATGPAAAAPSASSDSRTSQSRVSGRPTLSTGIGVDPANLGSLSAITRIVGAQDAWLQGWTGRGVDVAVVDTGVARVPGLNQPGQVVDGPDLSFDAATGGPLGVDAYGHGTFMAGVIAGRDAGVTASAAGCATCLNANGYSTTASYVGVAPEARIVNVKVGAADGAADVTQVIAAVDWVTQHAHDPGMNIRVLNLSYGTTSTQRYLVDPLAQAVEQAWAHGIVVVASAGNDGNSAVELADPAYDPFVLAAGGLDPGRVLDATDDKVASFAEHGTAARPVDVLAPAVSVVGLRVPGGYVDGLVTNRGRLGERFQRGSGTSQAAAVVSGLAALVLQRYPWATPDQVKALVNGTARALPRGNMATDDAKTLAYSGHGTANAADAVTSALPGLTSSRQSFPSSTGTGTLDATRNGVFVTDGGMDLIGQRDVFGRPFDSTLMARLQVAAAAWNGGVWNGSRWSGDYWTASGWSSSRWSGSRWSGGTWDGSRWSGGTWSGSRWSGGTWDGSRWSGSRWSGSRWSLAGWS
jgi:serine protease AprX